MEVPTEQLETKEEILELEKRLLIYSWSMKLIHGDSLEELKKLPENSIDAIVTDPPYGLSFMGKKWDYDVPSKEIWAECLRVLKPGGYLLSFAGTRTQHKIASGIEDAGFEIRDMIAWVYGSGFPKSLNIGKAVDKLQGNERESFGKSPNWRPSKTKGGKGFDKLGDGEVYIDITKGTSEWEGWGTALKPALEPITVARKPIEGTVAENCLKWGVGGINIDECRIPTCEDQRRPSAGGENGLTGTSTFKIRERKVEDQIQHAGRFPANLIHDGSDEVVELFPNTKTGDVKPYKRLTNDQYGGSFHDNSSVHKGDSGSAARFFYCAKASKSERNMGCDSIPIKDPDHRTDTAKGSYVDKGIAPQSNCHPTVKPVAIMEYLVRLVSREGSTILDPFMGSGTTGIACKKLKRHFIGIEKEAEYIKIAQARIDAQPTHLL